MNLKVKDRLMILNILPEKGDFATMVVKSDLKDKINITQEEIKELDLKEENNSIKWNSGKDQDKEFELTELEVKLIKDTLDGLDKAKQLTDDTFNLLKLFQ